MPPSTDYRPLHQAKKTEPCFDRAEQRIADLAQRIRDSINESPLSSNFTNPEGTFKLAKRIWNAAQRCLVVYEVPETGVTGIAFPKGPPRDPQKGYIVYHSPKDGLFRWETVNRYKTLDREEFQAIVRAAQNSDDQNWRTTPAIPCPGEKIDQRNRSETLQDIEQWLVNRWQIEVRPQLGPWMHEAKIFPALKMFSGDPYREKLKGVYQIASSVIIEVMQDSLKVFEDKTDHVVRQELNGIFPLEKYNFCVSAPFEEAKRRRAWWAGSFPGFYSGLPSTPVQRDSIDTGRSFTEVAAEQYATTPFVIRRLRAYDPNQFRALALGKLGEGVQQGLHEMQAPSMKSMICYLSRLPVGMCSEIMNSDLALTFCASETVALFVQAAGDEGMSKFVTGLLQAAGSNWQESANGIVKERAQLIAVRDLIFAASKVLFFTPYFQTYAEDAVDPVTRVPRFSSDAVPSEALSLLFKGRSVAKLLNFSREWHKQFGVNHIGNHRISDNYVSWPPLCDTYVTPNGYTVVSLDNSADLAEEGAKMHHCVGGHADRCVTTPIHIVSIRDVGGRRISTCTVAEKRPPKGGETFYVEEHKGPGNVLPSIAANEALKWFIRELNSGAISVDLAGIHKGKEKAKAEYSLNGYCGVDIKDHDAVEKRYRNYRKYLPAEFCRATYAEYCAQPAVIKTLKAVHDRITGA